MNRKHNCAQQWQAEAIEDGRLSGAERAAFERHAMYCETCNREIEDLARLGEIMSQVSVAASTPFEHKHLRMELLRRADSALGRNRAFPVRRAVVFAMAAAACVLLAIFGARRSATVDAVATPAFDVVASGPARWSSERLGALGHVVLVDGAVWVHVERTRSDQRFLLTTPDGEIEVRGTRFLTVVGKGSTNHVEVSAGIVSLRLRGEREITLRAGESWDRPIAEGEPAPVAAAPPAKASASRSPKTVVRPASEQPDNAAREPAVDPFVAGVQAFRSGDYASADEQLARFAIETPADPRIEDAFFLRAVATARQGKKAIAADLARAYLARFPKGLRRPEAERISAQGGTLQR
jgi:hypothetical protein